MVRLLHTADVHLGHKFLVLADKGAAQREQIKDSFKKLISRAIAEHVDIVLIAGDLFDSNQQSQTNVDFVIEQFHTLAANNIPACLIPGTHDCFDSISIYKKVDFQASCPGLTIFTSEGWNYREFPHLGLTVYGKPNFSNRSPGSPLEGLRRLTDSRYHVAMAHGSLNIPGKVDVDDYVFTVEEIQHSQMDYIALGHWHSPYPCSDKGVVAWYSGAPEFIEVDQKQSGSILVVTILESGEVKVEPRQTGIRCFNKLDIDLTDMESRGQLKNKIAERANPNLIMKVVLKGYRDENVRLLPEELEADLSEQFFHLRIDDESHPKISQFSEDAYEGRLILTRFIKLMKEHIETCESETDRTIAEEALQYGLALLQEKDVF